MRCRRACEEVDWVEDLVAGYHLEGPYISPEDGPRGAHPREHVRPPDWEEFCRLQEASGNRIRLVTLAPEWPSSGDFIRRATASGIVVALGHTNAQPEDIARAADAGAQLSTHLGNGAHGTIRRHPNYIWEQLGEDRLAASIITDGHHLPDSVIRTIVRTKSPEKTIITCDAAGLAGCPPGLYSEGTVDVEVLADGRIVIAGQRQLLAGSGASTEQCVPVVMRAANLDLATAWQMASVNPARLLGYEVPQLVVGGRADVVTFYHRDTIQICQTVARGICRYPTLAN